MNPKLNESTRQILLRRGWVEQPDGSVSAPTVKKERVVSDTPSLLPIVEVATEFPITFFVPGQARPAGSKRGFALKKAGAYTGSVAMVDGSKYSAAWKKVVAQYARIAYRGALLTIPLKVTFGFVMARPLSHYGTGRNAALLRDDAPRLPVYKPDALKLSRAVEDALTGIIWQDDALIVTEIIRKRYGTTPGVIIMIEAENEP